MKPNPEKLKLIIEGALLAAGRPLSIDHILTLFLDEDQPSRDEIRAALMSLQEDCAARSVELKEVSSGFRYQVKAELAEWIARLWEEKPAKYSRAVLETMALIAYRQPITRSEIEDVRGVSVSSHIVKSLLEREWIRVIGHRDVPGKPALYGTTKTFLDYFGLRGLSDLPPLAELRNIDSIEHEFDFGDNEAARQDAEQAANDAETGEGAVQPVVIAQSEADEVEASDGMMAENEPAVAAADDENVQALAEETDNLATAEMIQGDEQASEELVDTILDEEESSAESGEEVAETDSAETTVSQADETADADEFEELKKSKTEAAF